MKTLALLAMLFTSLLMTTGCSSPGYSAGDNVARISRNWEFERGQFVDDWDHFWLMRDAGSLTIWNLRTSK